VEIARCLAIDPAFILLDEPFSGIDPIAVLELQQIIFDLKNSGIGVLITDHNVRETLSVTDRAYIINEGRIFFTGTPGELGRNPEVKRIYLGENFSLGQQSPFQRPPQLPRDNPEDPTAGPEAEPRRS
jgi:lipopolysaccharide export system ATP-binding protein